MKKVLHLLFVSFCLGFIGLTLQSEPAQAKDVKSEDLDAKLDSVSCAASGYIDNLDGTLCDCTRNLMWEKKDGNDGNLDLTNPHDVDNRYTWSINSEDTTFSGTAKTEFLDRLNDEAGGGVDCFADHCDWRLPEASDDAVVKELETIVDLGEGGCGDLLGACINPIFGPTSASNYWSSTTVADNPPTPELAYTVDFLNASVVVDSKNNEHFARAVRPCM